MNDEKNLIIVWTSGDREVALNMVFMYAFNSMKKGWWEQVNLIVWGPSSKLLTQDKELQDYIKRMKDIGIIIEACKTCADNYGVSEDLENLGITVRFMGEPLTSYLKEKQSVITF
jgi:hypothetical protein